MNRLLGLIKNVQLKSEYALAIGFISIILMMIIPMHTVLLDIFLACNLLFSIVIILNVLYIKSPLEFTVFPTVLLMATIFSLALNVSSTRLILTQGENFRGTIIRSFGSFVVGSTGTDGLVVGAIIFVIIVVVQFIVISKGATRVSEVAAKFRLDSLPGKQMAIDAEFSSGSITEEEYNQKKSDLQRDADFYGSMDGASKFVSGNIKAGIFITFINIIGGLIVGVLVRGENVNTAVRQYIQLTIGDGLVSQLPALLISTATGIIVTQAVSDTNITANLSIEFSKYMRIYFISGIFLSLLAFLPGFPWYILLPMGTLLITLSVIASRKKSTEQERISKEKTKTPEQAVPPKIEPLEPIALEVGYDLIPLVLDEDGTSELLNRVSSIRAEIGVKYGSVVPLMRTLDNALLNSNSYSIKMNGVEIGKGSVQLNKLLAIQTPGAQDNIEGEDTFDPAYGLPAKWITSQNRVAAERAGYTVVDIISVISTHISTLVESHAADLLSRQDVANMIEDYKSMHPVIIEEVRKHLEIVHIHHVFRKLLRERVSIRNLTTIFEVLGDYGVITKDIDFLVEKCRQGLSRQISKQYADDGDVIYAYFLHQQIEQTIANTFNQNPQAGLTMLNPKIKNDILKAISSTIKPVEVEIDNRFGKPVHEMRTVVLVTSELARPLMNQLLSGNINKKQYNVPILSLLDISTDFRVEKVGEVSIIEKEVVHG